MNFVIPVKNFKKQNKLTFKEIKNSTNIFKGETNCYQPKKLTMSLINCEHSQKQKQRIWHLKRQQDPKKLQTLL